MSHKQEIIFYAQTQKDIFPLFLKHRGSVYVPRLIQETLMKTLGHDAYCLWEILYFKAFEYHERTFNRKYIAETYGFSDEEFEKSLKILIRNDFICRSPEDIYEFRPLPKSWEFIIEQDLNGET